MLEPYRHGKNVVGSEDPSRLHLGDVARAMAISVRYAFVELDLCRLAERGTADRRRDRQRGAARTALLDILVPEDNRPCKRSGPKIDSARVRTEIGGSGWAAARESSVAHRVTVSDSIAWSEGISARVRMGENAPMVITADDSGPVRIVTAILRDGDRVLLCHRSAGRRWYPDVWDLPGGHVEEGEDPKESLVRELREELGITASEPSGPPTHEIRTATFYMQIWLVDRWTGTPVNAAPDEHDAVAWFETSDLGSLRLAHESYLSMLTAVLAE